MTPPRWTDEHGTLLATRPWPRCGKPTPVGRTFRREHLRMSAVTLVGEAARSAK